MIRLLLLALLCFLAYTAYQAVLRALTGRGAPPRRQPSRQGEEMVRDPQCGTYIPRADALEKTVAGTRHYFCSRECRDAFARKA